MAAASLYLSPAVVAALDAVTPPGTDPSVTGVNVRAR
jgi:hypothetical protein